jgi:benzoyl-CoA reductase/2-hydroxyglutaryl-CoA dehydratase subunit BcrC/BadD/HgdB
VNKAIEALEAGTTELALETLKDAVKRYNRNE